MAIRSSWKGFLKLSLVSVPVQALNVHVGGASEIRFHQLHAACHSRIRYQKVCPVHGEVSNDEIVSGYEYAPGKYAIVEPEELKDKKTGHERAITIDEFIEPDELDPLYLDGRNYYLLPDTPAGQKPYAVLHAAMLKRDRQAIARIDFSGRQQLVVLRALERVVSMSLLNYAKEIREPASLKSELDDVDISSQEVRLAEMLIDASTHKKFDYAKYEDQYAKEVTAMVESKVAGKEVVTAPADEEVRVINLMDALKQSLGRTKRDKPAAKARPAKKLATARRRPTERRRKTS